MFSEKKEIVELMLKEIKEEKNQTKRFERVEDLK